MEELRCVLLFCFTLKYHYSGDGGTSSENAIELAPLEHDSSHAKKRVTSQIYFYTIHDYVCPILLTCCFLVVKHRGSHSGSISEI